MSENDSELGLVQLKISLQQAAFPAERQIARLKGYDVPFEVADDLSNWSRWALGSSDVRLTDEQRSCLIALDSFTNEMSDNAHLWTDEALLSRPEWDEVRSQARKLLELFQWPLEDGNDPGVKVV